MVFAYLRIRSNLIKVDPLYMMTINDFWRSFYLYNDRDNKFTYHTSEHKIYLFEDENNYGHILTKFIESIAMVNAPILFRQDIEKEFDKYYILILAYGGINNLKDLEFILNDRLQKDTSLTDDEKIQYNELIQNINQHIEPLSNENMNIYNLYNDKEYDKYFDFIMINGNRYKAWIEGLKYKSSNNIEYDKTNIKIPDRLTPYITDYIKFNIVVDNSALSKLEGITKHSLIQKFNIRCLFILFNGATSYKDLRICYEFGLDPYSGYKLDNNGKVTLFNLDKIQSKLLEFIITNEFIDIKEIPVRSKTGLSRKHYNHKISRIVSKINKINVSQKMDIAKLGYCLSAKDGIFIEYENKDIEDLINGKITTIGIPNNIAAETPTLINKHKILDIKNISKDASEVLIYIKTEYNDIYQMYMISLNSTSKDKIKYLSFTKLLEDPTKLITPYSRYSTYHNFYDYNIKGYVCGFDQ